VDRPALWGDPIEPDLTDQGLLRAAIRFRDSAERGADWVKEVFERAALQVAKFKAAYPVGRETLGSVVYVSSTYALVQLQEGITGILH
jgi:hypothetical protein